MKCMSCQKEAEVTIVDFLGKTAILYCDKCRLKLESKKSDVLDEIYREISQEDVEEGKKWQVGFEEDIKGNVFPVKFELMDLSNKEQETVKGDNMTEDWIKEEADALEKERAEALKEKGLEPLFKFPQGETKITLDPKKRPDAREAQGRKFKVFDLKVNDEPTKTGINVRSPLYREFINRLSAGNFEFIVVRTGTGLATRYSIKE